MSSLRSWLADEELLGQDHDIPTSSEQAEQAVFGNEHHSTSTTGTSANMLQHDDLYQARSVDDTARLEAIFLPVIRTDEASFAPLPTLGPPLDHHVPHAVTQSMPSLTTDHLLESLGVLSLPRMQSPFHPLASYDLEFEDLTVNTEDSRLEESFGPALKTSDSEDVLDRNDSGPEAVAENAIEEPDSDEDVDEFMNELDVDGNYLVHPKNLKFGFTNKEQVTPALEAPGSLCRDLSGLKRVRDPAKSTKQPTSAGVDGYFRTTLLGNFHCKDGVATRGTAANGKWIGLSGAALLHDLGCFSRWGNLYSTMLDVKRKAIQASHGDAIARGEQTIEDYMQAAQNSLSKGLLSALCCFFKVKKERQLPAGINRARLARGEAVWGMLRPYISQATLDLIDINEQTRMYGNSDVPAYDGARHHTRWAGRSALPKLFRTGLKQGHNY